MLQGVDMCVAQARAASAGRVLAALATFTMLASGPAWAAANGATDKDSQAAIRQEETKTDAIAGLVADWLERSAREYQSRVAGPLSIAEVSEANGLDSGLVAVVRWALSWVEGWVGTGKPANVLAVADVARVEGVRQLADAREYVLEQKRKEEAELKAREAERKADLARRHEENERRIAEKLKQLDEAHKRAQEKRKREAEQARDEEAKKAAADKRAALELERDTAEQNRLAEESSRRTDAERQFAEAQPAPPAHKGAAVALLAQPPAEQLPEVATAPASPAVPPVRAEMLPGLGLPTGTITEREETGIVEAAASETITPVRQAALDKAVSSSEAKGAGVTKSKQTVQARKATSNRAKARACNSKGACGSRKGRRLYVVRAGDTLSAIAARHLGSRGKYSAIFLANRNKIRNPNVIIPGQRLYLPVGKG